ncbi:thiamine diphosphokinase [Streptococcus pluranimalium]|uniref:thiamine diphosphokinase n=1 Tax=Streptococcus pluranimalium TaxID=82348 RepID=UPI0039FD200C
MIRAALMAGGDYSPPRGDFDIYIGIDRGALKLLEEGWQLDWAVGDFDSISDAEFETIKHSGATLYSSSAEKDDTDTELALKHLFAQYPQAEATLFGVFGGRMDHLLSNVFLPSDPELAPFMSQIHLADETNYISYLPQGKHTFQAQSEMTYLAFMTDDEAVLTILGAKYDLTAANYFKKKIYSSNESIGQPITVVIPSGYVVVIESKD